MLRFPLAILVVFAHSFGSAVDVEQLHADGLSGMAVYDYLRIFISAVIARSAVPLFFIFSGFLFFKGVQQFDRTVYVEKLRKRWHSLAQPYLLWNILFILWTLALMIRSILLRGKPWSDIGDYFAERGYLHILWDSHALGEDRTTWLGVVEHSSGPELYPFWYMRDLMIMVVLAPVIYWLIKRLRLGFVLLLMAIYLLDIRMPWFGDTEASAILFFSIGAYFSIMKQDFTQVLWRWRYVICPLAIILIVAQTATGSAMGNYTSLMVHHWLVVVQTFAFIIMASALCRYKKLYEWNRKLAPTSFFIYALHPFILGVLKKIVVKLTPMSDMWYMQCIDYLLAPLACVALCIAIYTVGRRWMPGAMKLLMGERRGQ